MDNKKTIIISLFVLFLAMLITGGSYAFFNWQSSDDMINKIRKDINDYNYASKHTYKKNKTGYYWYSTEMVEEE